jgi:uncharacterized membrane protein YgcG
MAANNPLDPLGDVIRMFKNAYTIGIVMALPFLALLWILKLLASLLAPVIVFFAKIIGGLLILIGLVLLSPFWLFFKLVQKLFGIFGCGTYRSSFTTGGTRFSSGNTARIIYKGGSGWTGGGFKVG